MPKFDDDVVFGSSEFLGILSSDVTVKSVSIGAGGLSVQPGGHLTVTNGGGVGAAGLSVDGGAFDINGTFVLSMSSFALSASKNGVITRRPDDLVPLRTAWEGINAGLLPYRA